MPSSLVIARFTFRQIIRTRFYWVATILAIIFTLLIGTVVPLIVQHFASSEDAATRSTNYTNEAGEFVELKVFWDGRATYERKVSEDAVEQLDFFEGWYWRRQHGRNNENQSMITGPRGRVLFKGPQIDREYRFEEFKLGMNTVSDELGGGTLEFKKETEDSEEFIRVIRTDEEGEETDSDLFQLATEEEEWQAFKEGMRYAVHGGIIFLGNMIAIFLSMNLIPIEIVRRSIYNLISKPVGRGDVLFGKMLGIWGVCLVYAAILSTIGVIALLAGKMGFVPYLWRSVFIGGISMLAFSALTMMISTLVRGVGAGFLALIAYLWSSNMGILLTVLFGEMLKIPKAAKFIINVLPPSSELGRYALYKLVRINVDFQEVSLPSGDPADLAGKMEIARSVNRFLGFGDVPIEGLVVMLIYLAAVMIIGWLIFRRRQFN